ncbi:MAG: hypothetical protein M3Z03_12255 [Actinomycetota bacterium]|nr:hypothetical protein [Actinomycetota bacterium]
MSPTTTYCTILAENYLPRALSLADSLRRHHPGATLNILFIDIASDDDLPTLDGVRCLSTEVLGLGARAVLDLATIYDLVEFATAVKPPLLRALLEETEQVIYLDPDTYLTAPMAELDGALASSPGGIVVTPHFLEPVPEGVGASEGHMLAVGINNLGFCAVDRRSRPFLDWWWGHLEFECINDPLSGLFVDQKWVDIGSSLFQATALRHYGYNVGILNLHERPIGLDDDGYVITSTGDRLRLFHFHSFSTSAPEELSVRFRDSSAHLRQDNHALDLLCKEYAADMVRHEEELPPAPAYPYWTDTSGRHISRQTRRVFRKQLQGGAALPSPFVAGDAVAWDRWRSSARTQVVRDLVGDLAKTARVSLPEQTARFRKRFPKLAERAKSRYVSGGGMWK